MTYVKMVGVTFLFLLSLAAAMGGAFASLSMVSVFFEVITNSSTMSPLLVVVIFLGGLLLCAIGIVGAGWSAAKVKEL